MTSKFLKKPDSEKNKFDLSCGVQARTDIPAPQVWEGLTAEVVFYQFDSKFPEELNYLIVTRNPRLDSLPHPQFLASSNNQGEFQ
jgi:hypothetical protein